jgi:hypothetical protein
MPEVRLMTLSIDLNEQLQARLEEEARRQGVAPPEYARRVLEQRLLGGQTPEGNRATLELLAEWERERRTGGDAASGDRELEELKRSLNDNRASGRKPFP